MNCKTTNDIEQPVDVVEIADFLSKSPSTIRNWCSTNSVKIPRIKLGNKYMFFKSEVTAWLRKQQENL